MRLSISLKELFISFSVNSILNEFIIPIKVFLFLIHYSCKDYYKIYYYKLFWISNIYYKFSGFNYSLFIKEYYISKIVIVFSYYSILTLEILFKI